MAQPTPEPAPGGEADRSRRVTEAVALGTLAGMLLSPRLWLSSRTYPLSPVADFWPAVPAPYDAVWFAALLGLLVAIPLVPRPRVFVLLFVALAALLSLGDQTRWQPWFYQYLVMFAALGLTRPPADGVPGGGKGLNACRLLVAATYFWSGLQKLNYSFVDDIYPWLMEPLKRYLPDLLWSPLGTAGLAPPIVETAIGLGLLVPVLRPVAVGAAVAMHALILFSIGPLGHDWNSVVWPWNIAMIVLVVRLFGATRRVPLWAVLWPGRSVAHWAVLLLFGVLPLLSFWGWWDSYLSAALYSGNTLGGEIVVNRGEDDSEEVSVTGWAIRELNVPPYPARRTYRNIARSLGSQGGQPVTVTLTIRERPDILTGKRERTVEVFDAK